MSDVAIQNVEAEPRTEEGAPAAGVGELRREHLGMAVVLLIGGALLITRLHDGWFPHDEGVLGQAAERVLLGEVPHRDFDDVYTGLLSYLNALAFQLLGTGSQAMRMPLFVAALLWTATLYRIFLRFATPVGASALALLILVWSVPNYSAAMPSWYNLFFATWGLAALFRWSDDGRLRWLFLAGSLGGVSFLFKLTGLFFVIAAAIGLAAATTTRRSAQPRAPQLWAANAALTLAYVACAVGLTLAVGTAGTAEWTRFVLPLKLLLVAFILREWTGTGGSAADRLQDVAIPVFVLLAGAAIPIGAFLMWFAAMDALPAVIDGVFIKPFQRVGFAQLSPPPPHTGLLAIPFILLLFVRFVSRRGWQILAGVSLATMIAVIAFSGSNPFLYRLGWYLGWSQLFVACAAGAMAAAGLGALGREADNRGINLVILASAVAALTVLVEYPYAAAIYTLYALPMAGIAVVAAVRSTDRVPVTAQWVLLAFFMTFGLIRVLPNAVMYLGSNFVPIVYHAPLDVPRGGIWVTGPAAADYNTVINLVREHGRDRVVWAGPDSPEIYFFGEARNHTRVTFDFFSPRPAGESFVDYMATVDPDVVVIKRYPGFSPPIDADEITELAGRYSWVQTTPSFFVLWR